eukprot:5404048-Prymnesium_polylepis.2
MSQYTVLQGECDHGHSARAADCSKRARTIVVRAAAIVERRAARVDPDIPNEPPTHGSPGKLGDVQRGGYACGAKLSDELMWSHGFGLRHSNRSLLLIVPPGRVSATDPGYCAFQPAFDVQPT